MLRKGRQPWTCFRVSLNNNFIINYKRFILDMAKTSPFIISIPTGSALDSNMCSVVSGSYHEIQLLFSVRNAVIPTGLDFYCQL